MQENIHKFYGKICGERNYQYLSEAVENSLAKPLNFENACILYYENKALFSINYIKDETGMLKVESTLRIPLLGLTGICIREKKTIISPFGMYDSKYYSHSDDPLKLRRIRNILISPLLNPQVAPNKEKEVIGVLQLINCNVGDIDKSPMVIII